MECLASQVGFSYPVASSSVWRRKRRRLARPSLLAVPALAFLAVFFVYPLWGLLLRSINSGGNASFQASKFTLNNYSAAFGNSTYWIMFRTTVEMALAATVVTVVMAYPVAYLMSRAPKKLTRFMMVAVMFPYFTSILIRLYAFTQILSPFGLNGTTDGAIIGMVAYLLPIMIVMLYAAMAAIDTNLGPAARTLGAHPRRVFVRIFFPLSRAGLIAATLFIFVVSLGFYVTPAVLGSSTDQVLSTYIQQEVNLFEWGVASAMGILLLAITLVLFAASNRAMSMPSAVASSQAAQKGVSSVGHFRWTRGSVALGIWSVLVVAFLLMPLIIVVWTSFTSQTYLQFPPQGYSLRWYRTALSDSSWFSAGWLSLKIAGLTAVISTFLGIGAAIALVRGRSRFRPVLRVFFYMPIIVPVVLLGASLFGVEVDMHINGSLLGYVIGEVVLTLPVAVIILNTALASASPGVEKAARTLGANPLRAFWRITVPAIAASLGSAALICFLMTWDEPVVSTFLTTSNQPLAVKYFLFLREQLLPSMAAVGTLLMAALVVGFVVCLGGSRLTRRLWRRYAINRAGRTVRDWA